MIPAQDELAIRNLAARWCDAVSKRDFDTWRALWTDDCHWYIGNRAIDGADTVTAFLSERMERYSWILLMSLSGQVFESDGEVRGIWYLMEYQGTPTEITQIFGTFEDVYAKVDGEWKIARRVFQSSYRGLLAPGQTSPVIAGGNVTLMRLTE